MATDLKPMYAYTVVYVKDVAKSVEFYGKAFGYPVRRLDDSHRYINKFINGSIHNFLIIMHMV